MDGFYIDGFLYHKNNNIGRNRLESAEKGIIVYTIHPKERCKFNNGGKYKFKLDKNKFAVDIKPA